MFCGPAPTLRVALSSRQDGPARRGHRDTGSWRDMWLGLSSCRGGPCRGEEGSPSRLWETLGPRRIQLHQGDKGPLEQGGRGPGPCPGPGAGPQGLEGKPRPSRCQHGFPRLLESKHSALAVLCNPGLRQTGSPCPGEGRALGPGRLGVASRGLHPAGPDCPCGCPGRSQGGSG